ncbi:uroporphyrinogen III methylase HemX [Legionella steigerwaltii]|uniref:Uroporphyrinogen III methylase HemX n=1 Tax=Legionella steigerwaltii TaxID=460 RepID=A0A378LEN5_9GAMM|nr:uroporphyrinogen-III C-methyltransferase [Legionella steigerwaltii]KTD78591.1 uroporphyrinogen III methylase HemX [Legionella steigerwaltii]STY24318.1 uroporphyrinogen III methylase HemX [Legionella steigerwaltii]
MVNGNEEQAQKTKKIPHTMQVEKAKPKSNPTVSQGKYLIPAFAFIVSLGALGVAAHTLSLNKQLHAQLNQARDNFSTQLQQLEQKQEQTQEQISAKTNNAEEIQTQLQTKFDHLNKQLQNAMNQRFYQNQDWLLLKARYYLELAQINAHWSNGVDSTIALLEQTDQLLKQLNDPKILNIRQAIAKDIAQMQALPSVDIAGLLSQLDAAQNSVNDLSIPLPISGNTPATENVTTTPNNSSWRSRLQSSMNVLEKLVVIRRHDQEIKPLMSPLFEALLKEKLHLNLQEAQWAVLNNEPFVYQLVLKQAINNLKMNFNQNTPSTAALIKKLTELQQMNVTQKRPTLGSALPMLNELIDAKKTPVNQSLNSENSEQGGNQ